MTGRLRPWSAIDEWQHKTIDAMFHADECLALLETGFGKTLCAMTAGDELHQQGIVKRPLVLAPLRVAQNNWPQERFEWGHLKHIEMVEWGGEPSDWADSLWKQSRILWGSRMHAEGLLRNAEAKVHTRIAAEIAAKIAAVTDAGGEDQVAQHVLDRYRNKFALNPNQVRAAIDAAVVPLEDKIAKVTAEERRINKLIRKTEPPACWHVTSFENIEWLTDLYPPGTSPFDLWIVDETGRLARNPKSPRYKAIKKHMPFAKIKWGLNATPAPEGLLDLFGQVQIVAGKRIWGTSFPLWRQKFFYPTDYNAYTWRPQRGAFEEIMDDLNGVAFRVPPEGLAYHKTIKHRQIEMDMPAKARAAYKEMEKQLAVELENGVDVVALSEASASIKLRQLTQGYLYEVSEKGNRTVHILHEEKLHALSDLIDSMAGEPLLVAYGFDQDLDNIRKVFKNVPYLGQGASARDVSSHIERWNKRELPVLALHPNSASHGLNLQYGGHHIVWLCTPWSLDAYQQTNARIDRRGQEQQCYGHHLIMRDSMDQRVSDALIEKDATQSAIIEAIRKL